MLDQILVDLSAAAYSEAPAWQFADVQAIRRDITADMTVVAFRGTCCTEDAIRDAEAWPTWDQALGFVHTGFWIGAKGIAEQIRRDLAGRKVIFTGHSLGGALALVTAALFVHGITFRPRGWPQVTDVVTFGAPRAGFRRMRRVLAPVKIRQYWLGDDPVPMVPWLLGCYVHARPLFHLDRPEPAPDLSFDLKALVDDHHIDLYRAAVARLTPREGA